MARAQKMIMTGLKVKMLAMPTAKQMIMDRIPSLQVTIVSSMSRSGRLGRANSLLPSELAELSWRYCGMRKSRVELTIGRKCLQVMLARSQKGEGIVWIARTEVSRLELLFERHVDSLR